jgi:hypothetical protein
LAALVRKLRDAARFALTKPEIRNQIVRLGMIPDPGPPPEKLAAYIDAEMARWGAVVKSGRHGVARSARRAIAEQKSTLGLRGLRRFHDLHHHGFGTDVEVAHHRVGDVLDQRTLLVDRSSLDRINIDFGHRVLLGLPCRSANRRSDPHRLAHVSTD